jgi:hypothetical protein
MLSKILVLASLSLAAVSAHAEVLNCPAPNLVNCVPAVNNIAGWKANGGQMTGNTFMPNAQCANVIRLGPDNQRLLCCYTKCGVFFQDVRAHRCEKTGPGSFVCD